MKNKHKYSNVYEAVRGMMRDYMVESRGLKDDCLSIPIESFYSWLDNEAGEPGYDILSIVNSSRKSVDVESDVIVELEDMLEDDSLNRAQRAALKIAVAKLRKGGEVR